MKVSTIKMNAGLTLIEMTLVVAVLLILIAVLFVGVAAYAEGSNRAKCILNISNLQKAARAYQNVYELVPGDPLPSTSIIGTNRFVETPPECKSGGTYSFTGNVPAIGTAYMSCSLGPSGHVPQTTTGW
jgi:prepilin-type N-terminal cleavage/methylation domain-containing protein